MRTLTLRKAAVAAALPLALGSLAACGNNDTSATADDPAASQAKAGSAVSSADFLALMKAAAKKTTTDEVTMTITPRVRRSP